VEFSQVILTDTVVSNNSGASMRAVAVCVNAFGGTQRCGVLASEFQVMAQACTRSRRTRNL
jgi:hypothetical protein